MKENIDLKVYINFDNLNLKKKTKAKFMELYNLKFIKKGCLNKRKKK